MKLSIRSSVVRDLGKILQSLDTKSVTLCFRIGHITRDGFIPALSHWQRKNIRESLETHNVKYTNNSGLWRFDELYTIGNINGHGLTLGKVVVDNTTVCKYQSYRVSSPLGPTYLIDFIDDYIQIRLQPCIVDIPSLFNPVKFVYGMLKPLVNQQSSSLTTKKDYGTPRCIPAQKSPTNKLVIAPFRSSGEWGTLVMHNDRTQLILGNIAYDIHDNDNSTTGLSIFHGYLEHDTFIIYLPTVINDQNVNTYNVSHRLSLAKRAILGVPYCRVTKVFTTKVNNQEDLCNRYGGVVYIPRHAKTNQDIEVYRPIHKIGVYFQVTRKSHGGFSMFELSDKNGIFEGTKDYPFHSPISLTKEDRDLLENFPISSIVEFRWENDNLVPYSVSGRIACFTTNCSEWLFLHCTKDLFKNTRPSPKALMMAQQRKSLKMLPVNKSVVFYSPVEGEDVLVRTGTIGEGSCLFHALLHAYSKDYATMDRKGRMKFVIRLRASMAGKVNMESWEEMGGGVISKVPYQENVREILDNFYKYISNGGRIRGRSTRRVIKKLKGDDDNLSEIYGILTELIPFDTLTSTCLPRGYDRTQDEKIDTTNSAVCEEVSKHLKSLKEIKQLAKGKTDYIENKMTELMTIVLEEAKNAAYRSYIKGLERVSEDVDTYTIEFISNRFNRDVYFLDGTNRLPYNTCPTTSNIKGRKSMIVLWVGGNHYEIVGRLLPGNRIQREFSADDELINRIRTFMTQPEKIKDLYPDLTEYLPRSYRSDSPKRRDTRRNSSDKKSTQSSKDMNDSDNESDQYYDSSDHDSGSESD